MTGLPIAPLLLGLGAGHAISPLLLQRVCKGLLYAILLSTLWGAVHLS